MARSPGVRTDRSIAYLRGSEPKYFAYNEDRLAVVAVAGGTPRMLTEALDRPISSPQFRPTASRSSFSTRTIARDTSDACRRAAARCNGDRAPSERIARRCKRTARIAVLAGTATQPAEIFALENGSLRQLSHQNDAWLAERSARERPKTSLQNEGRQRGARTARQTRRLRRRAQVSAAVAHPWRPRTGQDQHSFTSSASSRRERLPVLNVNYRGSNGRGEAYQRRSTPTGATRKSSICSPAWTTWSPRASRIPIASASAAGATAASSQTTRRDDDAVQGGDLGSGKRAANVDVRRRRVRLPVRHRARSAVEDAGSVDQAVVSVLPRRPHHDADAYMGGDKDFNVPVVGGEQMYQALRVIECADAAGHLPRPAPRAHAAELQLRPALAICGLV